MATSSTEGASALHVLQVGAQNQNATGFPASEAPSSVPPSSFGAEKSSTFDTFTGPAVGAAVATAGAVVAAADDTGAALDDGPAAALADAAVWAGGAVLGAGAPTLDGVADPHALSASSAAATTSGAARLGRRAMSMATRYLPGDDFCSRAGVLSLCDP